MRDGQLAKLTPQIGISSVERAEFTTGLPDGAQVVISPVGSFSEGQHVRTSYLDPSTAAGLNKKAAEEKPFNAFK